MLKIFTKKWSKKIMTISDEKKQKILTLYQKGVSKKDISRLENVSYPSIRSILNRDEIEEIQEEKKEIVVKKLIEIFRYEGYPEETIVNLIFNLKRIGEKAGKDLGEFVEDLEYILDCYNERTENFKLIFVFLLELATHFSIITDHIEAGVLINYIDNFIEREVDMEESEKYVAEIKEEAVNVWNETQKRIEDAKKEAMSEVESKSKTILKNSKEEYAEYQGKIKNAKKELASLRAIGSLIRKTLEKLEKENQNLRKMLKESDEKKSLLEEAFKRIEAIFPMETETIVKEIIKESQELEKNLQH